MLDEENPSTLTILSNDACLLCCLVFLPKPPPQLPTLHMILGECKHLPYFSFIIKNTLRKWCRKLRFCINEEINNCKCNNDLVLMLCLHPINL